MRRNPRAVLHQQKGERGHQHRLRLHPSALRFLHMDNSELVILPASTTTEDRSTTVSPSNKRASLTSEGPLWPATGPDNKSATAVAPPDGRCDISQIEWIEFPACSSQQTAHQAIGARKRAISTRPFTLPMVTSLIVAAAISLVRWLLTGACWQQRSFAGNG